MEIEPQPQRGSSDQRVESLLGGVGPKFLCAAPQRDLTPVTSTTATQRGGRCRGGQIAKLLGRLLEEAAWGWEVRNPRGGWLDLPAHDPTTRDAAWSTSTYPGGPEG